MFSFFKKLFSGSDSGDNPNTGQGSTLPCQHGHPSLEGMKLGATVLLSELHLDLLVSASDNIDSLAQEFKIVEVGVVETEEVEKIVRFYDINGRCLQVHATGDIYKDEVEILEVTLWVPKRSKPITTQVGWDNLIDQSISRKMIDPFKNGNHFERVIEDDGARVPPFYLAEILSNTSDPESSRHFDRFFMVYEREMIPDEEQPWTEKLLLQASERLTEDDCYYREYDTMVGYSLPASSIEAIV